MSSTNIQTYIDRAVQLEAEIAAAKEQLEEAKIKIQTELYAKMQNCNLNYAYASSDNGRAELMIRTKLNIIDPEKAMALIGAVAEKNIKVKTEPKYEIKTKFKIALTALLRMDYEEIDLKAILALLKAKPDAVEVLVKKLKGEYKKDLELLRAAGLGSENLEEELDAIRAAKNAELVKKYFDLSSLDVEELAKAISVEDTLALTISPGEQ